MRVVTLVAGDITNDTRVKREALGLARAGLDVTVVSRATGPFGDIRPLGPVQVLKVPVSPEIRTAVLEQRARRRARRPLPAWLANDEARQLLQRRREARQMSEADANAPHAQAWSAELAARATGYAERWAHWVDEKTSRTWQRFDELYYGTTFGVSWRRDLDGLVDDLERGYGPVIDALEPDVVHAHDMHVLGVAVHAARRAASNGRVVKVVYDAHEYVPGLAVTGAFTRRSVAAWADYEAHYVGAADQVLAVSEASADAIAARHGLPRPDVVLNVPVADELAPSPVGLRQVCGLADGVPLIAYAGIIREVRGIDTSIAALHDLPGVHLAVVCVPHSRTRPVLQLAEHVREQGLAERVHFVDPVEPGQVVAFLSSVDVGLVPMVGGWLNHELTLPNKLFEFVAAGVPVVASDLRSLGSVVRSRRLGETFTPGDPKSLSRAVRTVLEDLDGYRKRVLDPQVQEDFSWATQERVLQRVYTRMLGPLPGTADRPVPLSLRERPVYRDRTLDDPHLVLGPLNLDGRVSAVAGELRSLLPGATVTTSMLGRRRGDPAVDRAVTRETYRRDLVWQSEELRWLLGSATHVVLEDGLPLAGTAHGQDGLEQARILVEAGISVVAWVRRSTPDGPWSMLPQWRAAGIVVAVDDQLLDDPGGAGTAGDSRDDEVVAVPAAAAAAVLATALGFSAPARGQEPPDR